MTSKLRLHVPNEEQEDSLLILGIVISGGTVERDR